MKKWLYLAAVLATFYLNLVYEWPDGRYILVVELIFPVILYLQARAMGAKIKICPQGDFRMAEEGEMLNIPFVVENCGAFRISFLRVQIENKKQTVRNLKKGEKQTFFFLYQASSCGKHEIKVKKAVTADASGMFLIRIRKFQFVPAEIHIVPKAYPVLAEISEAVRLFVTEGEEYAKDRGGDDTSEVFDVHEYQPGDRIAQIHWKLSARTDELYMKEFSFPLGAAVILLLDPGESKMTEEAGNVFLNLAASAGRAMVEESCRFYAVWKESRTQVFKRFLVKNEETFYDWLLALSSTQVSELDRLDEDLYRHEFFEPYLKAVRIGGDLSIQCGEEMTVFFHEKTFVEELNRTVLEI